MHTEESLMELAKECTHKLANEANWHGLRLAIRKVLAERDMALRDAASSHERWHLACNDYADMKERAERAEEECERLRKLLLRSKRGHYYCEDSWYSCPKEPESGCADESQGTECNCGADEWNAEIDAAMQEKQP